MLYLSLTVWLFTFRLSVVNGSNCCIPYFHSYIQNLNLFDIDNLKCVILRIASHSFDFISFYPLIINNSIFFSILSLVNKYIFNSSWLHQSFDQHFVCYLLVIHIWLVLTWWKALPVPGSNEQGTVALVSDNSVMVCLQCVGNLISSDHILREICLVKSSRFP